VLDSWLPEGGTNLFQEIKAKSAEAASRGIKLLKLSIGQPIGPALLSARKAAARAVMSDEESMHEYQDNGSPGVLDFAQKFVEAQIGFAITRKVSAFGGEIDFLPILGIKPMLGLIPLACGASETPLTVATTTKPGYPTPADWSSYLGIPHYALPLNPGNAFRFQPKDIIEGTKLIMVNYPHNPSGQIAAWGWWRDLCTYCVKAGIRLFNDAAYATLAFSEKSRSLTKVAQHFPNLSWAEAFTASKAIGNGTGWRVGAIVGSADFVGDIKKIKGNTDSGFVAPMAAGALYALQSDIKNTEDCRLTYQRRSKLLIDLLVYRGMELAVRPGGTFYTLWKVPRKALGKEIIDAKDFNFSMIEKTGVVGVHFDPYIRYTVCGDIEGMADEIDIAFMKAAVSY